MANPNTIVIADVLFTPTFSLGGAFATTGAFSTMFVQQASVPLILPAVAGTLATIDDVSSSPLIILTALWS